MPEPGSEEAGDRERPLRLTFLVPGTGSYLCGSCLRDDALVVALRALGHEVTVVPLYLPLVRERVAGDEDARIYLGGINMFLDLKLPWLCRLPGFLRRAFDRPSLLRWASKRGSMTGAEELSELAYATLEGEHGPQAREFEELARALSKGIEQAESNRPDALVLSNVMLLGVLEPLHRALSAPILCTLQGEAPFLDNLVEPYKSRAWSLLAEQARKVDGFVAVSDYTGSLMAQRLKLDPERVDVVLNGIDLTDFEALEPIPPAHPTLGYLARMCPDKGLHTLVDAWLKIAERGRIALPRLRAAGVELASDRAYVAEQRAKIERAGLTEQAEFRGNITRSQKLAMLTGLTAFSVPATYGESFGLYLLEALGAGVPVVQPRHAAFPEVLERSGGGILCDANDPLSLAEALEDLLANPERARELGAAGRKSVLAEFGAERMAREFESVLRRCLDAARSASTAVAAR